MWPRSALLKLLSGPAFAESSLACDPSGSPSSPSVPRAQRRRRDRQLVWRAALASRLLVLAWCLLADALVSDHASIDARRFEERAEPRAPRHQCLEPHVSAAAPPGRAITAAGCIAWLPRGHRARPRWFCLVKAFTRWDAAYFLTVARDGYPAGSALSSGGLGSGLSDGPGWSDADFRLLDNLLDSKGEACDARVETGDPRMFAFFPLFPALVRVVAAGLHLIATAALGPSGLAGAAKTTAEAAALSGATQPDDGMFVVAAVGLSCGMFVSATVALHALGLAVFCSQAADRDDNDAGNGRRDGAEHGAGAVVSACDASGERRALAGALCLCASPANVFFATAYSESTFACLTFHGTRRRRPVVSVEL